MSAAGTSAATRPLPASTAVLVCAAIAHGVAGALAGYVAGPTLLVVLVGGLLFVGTVLLIIGGLFGVVVAGLDALITRRHGIAGRAALVVLAVTLVIAAEIMIDVKATGGYPTGWWTLAPLAGLTGFGTSLVVSRRRAATVVGVVALIGVGVIFVLLIQYATADNVYPPYVQPF